MDRSTPLKLISTTYTVDSIGQRIPTETARTVFCDLQSITRQEFLAAGSLGLKPSWVAVMFSPDYEGEQLCEVNGERYSIYRTYRDRNERLELYLERRQGTR